MSSQETPKVAEQPTATLIDRLNEAAKNLLYMSESDYPLEPFVWKREEQSSDDFQKETDKKPVKESPSENASPDASSSPKTFSPPTIKDVLKRAKRDAETKVEEITLQKFFYRPTKIEDWFGDEEKAVAQQFLDLKKLLEDNLKDIKVFRLGEIQIDVYVVGVDKDGNFTGVKTTVIET